jgi:hypothetical protein
LATDAYERLFAEFQIERLALYLLVIEATKAINWVIAEAASEVDRFYRFSEGLVLMRDGDGIFRNFTFRLEYETSGISGDSPAPYLGMGAIIGYLQGKIAEDAHYFDRWSIAEIAHEIRANQSIS